MKCLAPIKLKYYEYKRDFNGKLQQLTKFTTVGCGRCLACQSQKSSEWAMRCQHEAIYYNYGRDAMFITLTYDNEHIPANFSLSVKHLQGFWKRLRRRFDTKKYSYLKCKVKYFACGEYGSRKCRPHYHAIVFGLSYNNEEHKSLISSCWSNGYTYIGNVTDASVKYVAKYLNKSSSMFFNKNDYLLNTGRVRPFRCVSQGLGKRWLLDNYNNFIKNDYSISYDGVNVSIPRSYLRWLYKLNIVEDIHSKLKYFSQCRFLDTLKDLCFRGKLLFDDVIDKMKFMPEEFKYSLEYYPDFYNIWKKDLEDRRYIYKVRQSLYMEKLKYSNRFLPEAVS